MRPIQVIWWLSVVLLSSACAHAPFANHNDDQLCRELGHYESELTSEDRIYKRMLCDGFEPQCGGYTEDECSQTVGCLPQFPKDPPCPDGRVCARPEHVYQGCAPYARLGRNHFVSWLRCDESYQQISNCKPRAPRY